MPEEFTTREDRERRERRTSATCPGRNVSAERWARIFGTEREIAQRRREWIEQQGRGGADGSSGLPAVIDRDRWSRGYQPCLRCHVRSRAHEDEILARKSAIVGKTIRRVFE